MSFSTEMSRNCRFCSYKRAASSICPQNFQSYFTFPSLALSPTFTYFVRRKASSVWQMTRAEKAVILPQRERRFCLSVFYISPFFCPAGEGGKEVSVNRLMCSIHQTLYTSSTKQESALYARTIVPLRVAEKASYKLLQKKIALSSTPVESSIEWSRRTHMCSGERGAILPRMLNYSMD